MAVISELIDAGLVLKEQGNYQAAIEHFRQLHQTYPDHARIMFELAGAWQGFGVIEQALPLYRQLLEMPKNQALSPKDMPRLYTQMGACLRIQGQLDEALEVINAGLALYPTYRPLRAYRMFVRHDGGDYENAMLEAFDLMLEALAPTKWDMYEDDITAIVETIREQVPDNVVVHADADLIDAVLDEASAIAHGDDDGLVMLLGGVEDDPAVEMEHDGIILVEAGDDEDEEPFEIEVKVIQPQKSVPRKPSKQTDSQFGKNPVKIDIDGGDVPSAPKQDAASDDDDSTASSGKVSIPIDFD